MASTIFLIILGAFIGVGGALTVIAALRTKKNDELYTDYDSAVHAACKNVSDVYSSYKTVVARAEELKKEIGQLEIERDEEFQKHQAVIAKMEKDYDDMVFYLKQQNQKNMEAQQKENNEEYSKLILDLEAKKQAALRKYDDELQELKIKYDEKIVALADRKKEIEEEVRRYETQQQQIIERFKEDEATRAKAEFYSINIVADDKDDIEKLKRMAETLHNPAVLYKLIFETYYRAQMNAMFGRVLGEDKDKGGIYKITNLDSQKVYIGRTTNFKNRWTQHIKRGLRVEEKTNSRLYDALWTSGVDRFTFEIIEVCPKEEQSEREKYWISFYQSKDYGYNSNSGG